MAGRDSRTPGFPSQCPWVPLDVCSLPPALPMPMPMPMAMPMPQFSLGRAAPYLKSCGCPEVLLGAALLSLLPTPTLLLLLYLGQEEVLRMGAAESPPCPAQPHNSAPPAPAPRFWGAELMGALPYQALLPGVLEWGKHIARPGGTPILPMARGAHGLGML